MMMSRILSKQMSTLREAIREAGLSKLETNGGAMHVTWTDGFTAKFHNIWLRDHCSCEHCQHPLTKQRQLSTATIPLDAPAKATLTKEALNVEWKDVVEGSTCTSSSFTSEWLRKHVYSTPKNDYPVDYKQDRLEKKVLWGKDLMEKMPTMTYDAMMHDGFRDGMKLLQQHGLLLVKNTPDTMDATEAFARKIGFVLETIYGKMWTTRPQTEEMSYNDTASTNLALPGHTDCTYLYTPPGLQIFNCVQQSHAGDPNGGSSRYVDGFHVAEWLRAKAPDAYDFFCRTKLPFYCIDDDTLLATMEPIIKLDYRGNIESFRLNDGDRSVLTHLSFEDTFAFYKHHKVLWQAINELEIVHKLHEGDMMIVDNQRVLHGRHAFIGERALIGCYIGKTEYDSRLRVLGLFQHVTHRTSHGIRSFSLSYGRGECRPGRKSALDGSFERYQCHACFQFFHLDPKKHCYMCGEVVCMDCRQQLLIEGSYMNETGAMGYHTCLRAKVCLPCYFTFFRARSVGFIEMDDDDDEQYEFPSEEYEMTMFKSLPTIHECSKAKLAPLETTKTVPTERGSHFDKRLAHKVLSMGR
ncbi:trimethyllysine dioxygenase [Thraustotheca clavata]|uniref:trimethyllysine dioxygenase n=1 Tax=Thraustotheca clavata TaxID=74557 RepID=A0A1W0A083_9STRA|nr:trimethyllysine dioxygenase [Thraustotheca clavata]